MEQQKTAAVTAAKFKQDYGSSFIYELTFDNGDKGDYFSSVNNDAAFKPGTTLAYTIEQRVNGKYTNTRIKIPKAGAAAGAAGVKNVGQVLQTNENKRAALAAAVALTVAGKKVDTVDTLIDTAKNIYEKYFLT